MIEHSLRRVMAVAIITSFIDGYDVQLLPMLVPSLARAWHVNAASFSPAMAATLLGYAVGGILLAPWGDRIGRKPLLAIALLVTALSMAGASLSSGLTLLSALRPSTGVGVGAALVTVLAMIADAAPAGRRATLITVALTAFTLGSAASGAAVSLLMAAVGWRALFVFGAIAPLAALAVAKGLPDLRASRTEQPVKVSELLSPRWRSITLPLWAVYTLISFLMFFLSSWWPTVLVALGYAPGVAAGIAAATPIGAIAGGFCAAYWVDRGRALVAMVTLLALGAAAALVFPAVVHNIEWISAAVLILGFAIGGAQFSVGALAMLVYPLEMRSTGAGWASGIARVGSICGPLVGGWALHCTAPSDMIAWLALPAALAVLPVAVLIRSWRRDETAATSAFSRSPRPARAIDRLSESRRVDRS